MGLTGRWATCLVCVAALGPVRGKGLMGQPLHVCGLCWLSIRESVEVATLLDATDFLAEMQPWVEYG